MFGWSTKIVISAKYILGINVQNMMAITENVGIVRAQGKKTGNLKIRAGLLVAGIQTAAVA